MPEPAKKKSLLEWIMLAIGLSYGDEGEEKWAKRRREMEERRRAEASRQGPEPPGDAPRPPTAS